MSYVDHYEIQSRRPGEQWEHIGNIYPKYRWEIYRPWYFLWLVKRPRIVNGMMARVEAIVLVSYIAFGMPRTSEHRRFLTWVRYPLRGLRKIKAETITIRDEQHQEQVDA